MEVKKLKTSQLETNCYLIWEDNREALIIDPGDSADFLSEEILSLNLKPKLIIATHGHFDHVMAAWELQQNFQIPFAISSQDASILKHMGQSARYWLKLKNEPLPPSPNINRFLKGGDKIILGKNQFKIIETPGHTPGGICLYCQTEKLLLTGDTLFAQGYGRTDFRECSIKQLKASLKKLFHLPTDTKVLPGHGRNALLGEIKNRLSHELRL